ncbi:CwfJ C-terminus 1-domain-containing protein-like protein [Pseudomassariella vexata]|uniref:CwfJ C-terminus 1-domain-containing protein-like protein n=1 Tax=Pseudomassariella vexata TaxID=1141098 RepID=A0A1Y2DDV2_9PEZI|nr:CwfJ C-terminus 1-domain-containing protein-like protein [Pseudomassariella vexata]ORY57451.1 CwfJ C-terminus 1-domain-containing protein-like protein [Pseudomassariella vexata]
MDGLDDFEKQLAAEKAERERAEERKHRKHRHHHRERSADPDGRGHRHHRQRSRDRDHDDDGHRQKRSRRSRDDEEDSKDHRPHRHHGRESGRHSHSKTSDSKDDLPLPDEELSKSDSRKSVRDGWMTDPSALGVDYTQRGAKREKTPPPKQEPQRSIHSREINVSHLQALNDGTSVASNNLGLPAQHETDYTFGDDGSQWRMTNLKTVNDIAKRTGRPIDEVAMERYGSLRDFDDAREERLELDRRATYGEGYVGKQKPSGELFQERKLDAGIHEERRHSALPTELEQGRIIPDAVSGAPAIRVDQTTLNKMRANLMKAKLRKAPDAAKLEAEYNEAAAAFAVKGPEAVVLNVMENRLLAGQRGEAKAVETKRGRQRGHMEENDEMTIEDMVREERRTRGQTGGDGLRLAERIAKDGKFDNDLEYMDENAEKLARRVQKSEINLKNMAVNEFQKVNKILDSCQLCYHEDRNQQPVAPVVSLGTRVYLTLPTEPEISDGGAVIVPLQHRKNLLECDDDEWEEIRNFMKSLTRMYHDQGREVIFYENAAAPQRHMHAAMQAVPIPYDLGDTAPAFFKEAMLSADEEWSQHKKIIDTGAKARSGLGKMAFRRSIAKEAPYFHAWFTIDGGLGHVVEDSNRWPRGDLFAREIIGGMLDIGPDVIKRQGRWHKGDRREDGFKKRWRKFDWTRVLTDE